MNYFALYNLPQQFDVDVAKLNHTYQALAQATHPDKFATASGSQKLMAVQKNAQVNDGYQVLKQPLLRAEHLLELRGITLNHEQKTMQDSAFLMQQMEWRERLECVAAQPDPLQELMALDDEILTHIKHQLASLQSNLDMQQSEADVKSADDVRKLKFLYKLRDEIERKEDELSDI